jgi:carbamate kinase
MNKDTDKIVGSVLKVTASTELDVSDDLMSTPTKSIAELLNEQETNKNEEKPGIEDQEEEIYTDQPPR